MSTPGQITKPVPTLAPNRISRRRRNELGEGKALRKNPVVKRY